MICNDGQIDMITSVWKELNGRRCSVLITYDETLIVGAIGDLDTAGRA